MASEQEDSSATQFGHPAGLRRGLLTRAYGALGLLRAGEDPRKVRAWGALALGSAGLGIQLFGLLRNPQIALAFAASNPLTTMLPAFAVSLARSARAQQKSGRGWAGLFLAFFFFVAATAASGG